MEFKSQRGPSFGNNFNNRTEEALGLAADSQMAVERGLFGRLKPWFGFVMLVERAKGSLGAVRVPSNMPFPADTIFNALMVLRISTVTVSSSSAWSLKAIMTLWLC